MEELARPGTRVGSLLGFLIFKSPILILIFLFFFPQCTMNKDSEGDGIPAELFHILRDASVEGLHSVCQQIWKTQQWPQDWRSIVIPIPKKGNVKKCSNYLTVALISHASKIILKILQASLQQ